MIIDRRWQADEHEIEQRLDMVNDLHRRPPLLAALILSALLLTSCGDLLSVENPGPIDEEALDNPDAIPGLVTGMSSDFSVAHSLTTEWGSLWSDDLTHSGTLGAPTIFSDGVLEPEDVDPWWGNAQRARWVAENGLERMEDLLGDEFETSRHTARAYLFAGFSNRLLGENSCAAVFDGGSQEPYTAFFERALGHFDNAYRVAENVDDQDLMYAAQAGRASVHAALGNWSEANNDAEQIPVDFRHEAIYSLNSSRENNGWPGVTIERGEYTVYGSPWEGLDDPRVPHEVVTTAEGDTATAANGITPWITQLKHETDADNIALAKGTEMLLIRAEYYLREQESIQEAMDLINEGRDFHGLGSLNASDLEEAWDILQMERGLDMWLEGRRFWDLRRWYEDDGPAHHDHLEGQDQCVPIGRTELDSNENL